MTQLLYVEQKAPPHEIAPMLTLQDVLDKVGVPSA